MATGVTSLFVVGVVVLSLVHISMAKPAEKPLRRVVRADKEAEKDCATFGISAISSFEVAPAGSVEATLRSTADASTLATLVAEFSVYFKASMTCFYKETESKTYDLQLQQQQQQPAGSVSFKVPKGFTPGFTSCILSVSCKTSGSSFAPVTATYPPMP